MKEFTQEELANWLQDPVTKAFRQSCLRRRESLKEQMVVGNFTRESTEGTALAHACIIGECKALMTVLDLELVDLNNQE